MFRTPVAKHFESAGKAWTPISTPALPRATDLDIKSKEHLRMEELNHVIAKKAEESKKEFIHTKSLDFDNQTKSRYFF